MAEGIETEKATREIEELVTLTINLMHRSKATVDSTVTFSKQARARFAEMRQRRYDEDAEVARNIYNLRELSKAKGAMSFSSISKKLDKPLTECNRMANCHERFIALPSVYQQALRDARKKASENIVEKLEAITAKAESEGKDTDLAYISREMKAMCGYVGKQNHPAQNPALKVLLKAVDAQVGILKKREFVRIAVELLVSKVGLYCEFEDGGAVSISSVPTAGSKRSPNQAKRVAEPLDWAQPEIVTDHDDSLKPRANVVGHQVTAESIPSDASESDAA